VECVSAPKDLRAMTVHSPHAPTNAPTTASVKSRNASAQPSGVARIAPSPHAPQLALELVHV